jgi:hypothetical protein
MKLLPSGFFFGFEFTQTPFVSLEDLSPILLRLQHLLLHCRCAAAFAPPNRYLCLDLLLFWV